MAMGKRKEDLERPYAPDFVSAESLAYRLDCSQSTIESYVREGLLPKPDMVGNLPRWEFAAVVSFIKSKNDAAKLPDEDEYLKGIRRGPTA